MAVDIARLEQGIAAGRRADLSRGITLVESRREDHQALARKLLQKLLPRTGRAIRIGLTGVPGVGKSTLIEALGRDLTGKGHKVAVLAVDPSSPRSGGSILGDKTRMGELARDENAFIRPSPTAGTLGGVAARTRESMLLCEAAGYDVIIVETVGAGQSETAVSMMTDIFAVLMLPGAGDELQGIKKGVLEIADMICVNKADGDNEQRARIAAAEYRAALNILTPVSPNWLPPVLTVSGLAHQGLGEMWATIERYVTTLKSCGEFTEKRQQQQVRWMWSMLEERLLGRLSGDARLAGEVKALEAQVHDGALMASVAVEQLWQLLGLSAPAGAEAEE